MADDDTQRLRAAFREGGIAKHLSCEQAAGIAEATRLPLRMVEQFALAEGIIPERYDRNIGTLGADGQRRLLGSCAIVVGLGGLGGYVVETLARLGVGRIVAADPDTFAENNLNRQLLCDVENLGSSKVEQAALRVGRVNPGVEFIARATTFDQLDDELIAGCDIVFDCLDSIEARRRLAARLLVLPVRHSLGGGGSSPKGGSAGKVLVHGAIAGWSGQVGLFAPGSDLMEKIYAGPKRGIETRLGNLPFTAAVAANLMVAAAVPVLLGRGAADAPRLQLFDLLEGDWQTVEL